METLYISTLIIVSLAVIAALLSHLLKTSIALIEIITGIIAGYILQLWMPNYHLEINSAWFTMLASVGALMLTFLAGLELDAKVIQREWRSAGCIGIASFMIPFLGCGAVAYFYFNWTPEASLLTGLILSTTSVAVVYGTLLECNLIETNYGKSLLATCFVTDLCTVMTLGFIFTPFSMRTVIFFITILAICIILPRLTKSAFQRFGGKPTAFEMKFILFFLIFLGISALWAGYEPVLPAFFVGIVLSGVIGQNHSLVKQLQTITFGFMTPFYFIRAGFLVSVPVLMTSIMPITLLLLMKIACKGLGIYPTAGLMNAYTRERPYTIFLMSTGLAFGSIAALFGLSHHIIDQDKYSLLIAVVVTSAIIPTILANLFYFPSHLKIQHNR